MPTKNKSKTKKRGKGITMRRVKSMEEVSCPLWYAGGDVLVTVVGSQGDTRMRISTPQKSREVGFPFVQFNEVVARREEYKAAAKKHLKRMGVDAKLVG